MQLICQAVDSVCRTQRWLIGQSGESCIGGDSLCVQTWFFFSVYKTFLKSEEQYFLSTKNKIIQCMSRSNFWMGEQDCDLLCWDWEILSWLFRRWSQRLINKWFSTKLLNMLHCLDERHSKECSITLNRQNKIYFSESQ